MILEKRNLFTYLSPTDDTDNHYNEKFLWSLLAFDDARARFTDAYRKGTWDGKTRLFNQAKRRFLTGLIGIVQRAAAEANINVSIIDKRVKPAIIDNVASWLDPLREQPEVLMACLHNGRGVVKMVTGAGKTEIIIALCISSPCKWLILTHKKDLLYQIADRFRLRTGENIGIVGDGKWSVSRVTVAMFQTLYARLKDLRVTDLLESTGGLIVDECHCLPSNTFLKVMNSAPCAYWRFGFSGTPLDRADSRNIMLIASTGDLLCDVTATSLCARGVLAKIKIKFLEVSQVVCGQYWADIYHNGVVKSIVRNRAVVSVTARAKKPTLLFIKEIEHGRILRDMIHSAGMSVAFIHGQDSSQSRAAASERLSRGDLDVLIASTIFDEGVDIPEIASIVNAVGGKSVIKSFQRAGRGMRITATKNEVEYWDIEDKGNRWLANHAQIRLSTYVGAGFEVTQVSSQQVLLNIRTPKF